MVALGFAFDTACKELGIGEGSSGLAKRERVYHFIKRLFLKGETDIDVLHRRAVIHFRNIEHDHGTR